MALAMQPRRTALDVVLGILLILGGLVILGNVVLATAISVLFIAWSVLILGVIELVVGLMRIRSDFSWSVLLGGAALTVLGLFMVRNPAVALIALTMMAGALFFATGIARLLIAIKHDKHRIAFIISGLASVFLGVWILINPGTATLTLLGTLMGIQVLLEGVTLLVAGQLRPADEEASPAVAEPAAS